MFCYGDRYVSMPLHVPLSPPVRWGRSCSWRRYPKRELRRWSRQRSVRSARCGRHFHWENALRRWYGRSILLCSEACWSGSAGRHSPFQCPAPSAPRCRMFSKTLRADSTIPCDCWSYVCKIFYYASKCLTNIYYFFQNVIVLRMNKERLFYYIDWFVTIWKRMIDLCINL